MRTANTNLKPLPARLNAEDVAQLLNLKKHDIPVLIAAKLLRPLGKPVPNATKFFARCVVEELAESPDWLHKATQELYDYWKDRNEAKRPKGAAPRSMAREETPPPNDQQTLSE